MNQDEATVEMKSPKGNPQGTPLGNPLGTERIGKLLCRFSIPCILSLLVSALYNIVDQIFIGQGVGYLGNAATNVAYPVTVIALGFALLIGDGCAARLSLSLGQGDARSGKRAIGTSMIALLACGILMTTIGLLATDPILYLFGATENCLPYARSYLRVILIGLPFAMFTSGMNAVIRADGSPRYSMASMIVGAVMNVILDPVAIFLLHWGVTGAAAATILGQAVSCMITLFYFRHPKSFRLSRHDFKPSLHELGRVSLLGISSFITQVAIVIVCAVSNNIMVKYGAGSIYGSDIPLSVIGIVMKVYSIVIAIVVGISVGGQPIEGFNYGAGKLDRVRETNRIIVITTGVIGIIATLLFELAPQALIKVFGSESETYTRFAVLCFRIYLGGILAGCIQKAECIFLQAIGRPVQATLLSLSRDIFFLIPLVLLLPLRHGIIGALWSAPIADALAIILTVFLARRETRAMTRVVTTNV